MDSSANAVDCHATASAVSRNDRRNAESQNAVSLEKVDSRISKEASLCGGAVVVLRDFLGRARLEVCGCPKNRVINRIAHPKPNPHHQHPSDSKILEIESSHALQAAGFLMRKQGVAAVSLENKGHRSAQADVSLEKPTQTKVDSRICDEKAGLCSGERRDKTCGLSTKRATNSLLYRAKPNPQS